MKTKLKGHHKRITGLAFSNVLNVLVSSGADSQVCETGGFINVYEFTKKKNYNVAFIFL